TPTPRPTPTPTPTPTPCVPGSGTEADGIGTIAVSGGQASFDFHVAHPRRFPARVLGYFMYSDPGAGISFGNRKLQRLTISGNHPHCTGTVRIGRRMRTCVVDVDGCPVTFWIRLGNVYCAGGRLS